MSMRNVTVESQNGIERIMIRATSAQKHLVKELREDKAKSIRKHDNNYQIFEKETFVRLVNNETVEKLLDMKVLEYVNPNTNKIHLALAAK